MKGRPMDETRPKFRAFKTAVRFVRLMSIVLLLAAVTACNSSKRLRKANVDEVAEGMSKKQVESILGPPTTVDKTTYLYTQGKDTVTIIFKDDKVQSKVSTLSE